MNVKERVRTEWNRLASSDASGSHSMHLQVAHGTLSAELAQLDALLNFVVERSH